MKVNPILGVTFLSRCALLGLLLSASAAPAFGDNFVFDVEYLGDDQTQLVPGSDEPVGQFIEPGDTFQWTIESVVGSYWLVESGGGFFPLMAFSVDPAGARTGDFTLVLRKDGADVFSLVGDDVITQEVHLGTNTVELPTGLMFDEMFLDFELIESISVVDPGFPVDTQIDSRLPIFGAPENNTFSPGIIFVPEPATLTLLAFALAAARMRRGERMP